MKTIWKVLHEIEEKTDRTSCGLAAVTINIWVSGVFKKCGRIQQPEIQQIFKEYPIVNGAWREQYGEIYLDLCNENQYHGMKKEAAK